MERSERKNVKNQTWLLQQIPRKLQGGKWRVSVKRVGDNNKIYAQRASGLQLEQKK